MTMYSQFCPVAKAAEVFGDRWSPIIIRELCFGTRSFGQLLEAAPPISRTVLAQRLNQLEQFGVVHIEPKPQRQGPSLPVDAGRRGFPVHHRVAKRVGLTLGTRPDRAG